MLYKSYKYNIISKPTIKFSHKHSCKKHSTGQCFMRYRRWVGRGGGREIGVTRSWASGQTWPYQERWGIPEEKEMERLCV